MLGLPLIKLIMSRLFLRPLLTIKFTWVFPKAGITTLQLIIYDNMLIPAFSGQFHFIKLKHNIYGCKLTTGICIILKVSWLEVFSSQLLTHAFLFILIASSSYTLLIASQRTGKFNFLHSTTINKKIVLWQQLLVLLKGYSDYI